MKHILSILIFLPIALAIPAYFFGRKNEKLIKVYTLIASLLTFGLSVYLYFIFSPDTGEFQFVEKAMWIKLINAQYFVGIDGISLLLILLSTLIFPVSIIASWNTVKTRVKEFYILLLVLEGALIGVFCALDLVLFYVFWEFILIPMYFLIGIWGGEERIYAAVKFFLYTMFGSVLLLIGIIWLAMINQTYTGAITFDITQITVNSVYIPPDRQLFLFILFTLGFLIKVPLFPFHTWLPDAHVQAPTAGSVILAALLLKMGTYGILRFSMGLFPVAFIKATPYIAVLSVIGIIYGALLSIVQKDMKKLVAYSSVSHLGFIVLGMFALTQEAMQGAVIQMINHGLSTGALFLIVGMLYERRHTKEISRFGGVRKVMPVFAGLFLLVSLSSIGLPGLNGFIGEFLILAGSFGSFNLGTYWYTILSTTAVILSAVYLLWLYQRVMLGPLDKEENKTLKDIDRYEMASLLPLIVFIIWIGVYPNSFLRITDKSVKKVLMNFDNAKVKMMKEMEFKKTEDPLR